MGITNKIRGVTLHAGGFSGNDPDQMTGAEVKAAYEGEANAYTDTKNTKLAGIDTAAKNDQTGAEIKTAYEGEASAFTDTQFTKLAALPEVGEVVGVRTATDTDILVLTDAGKVVEMNNAGAKTITVPPNADVAFPINTIIRIVRVGAGTLQVLEGAAVTVSTAGGDDFIATQFSGATLYKRGTDDWVLFGDLAAS